MWGGGRSDIQSSDILGEQISSGLILMESDLWPYLVGPDVQGQISMGIRFSSGTYQNRSVNQHFTTHFNFDIMGTSSLMQHLPTYKKHAKCTCVQSIWWQNPCLKHNGTVQYQQGHSNNSNITLNLGSVSHNNYLGSVSHKTCDSHSLNIG